MKNLLISTLVAVCLLSQLFACKKEPKKDPEKFNSPAAVLNQFKKPAEKFSFEAANGATLTTNQGTVISIQPMSFRTPTGVVYSGKVDLEFIDVYKKSDIILNDMPTQMMNGDPLVSAGEFFIKAEGNGQGLNLNSSTPITITTPATSVDTSMTAFRAVDTAEAKRWVDSKSDNVYTNINKYVVSVTRFSSPESKGTWINIDDKTFFQAYSKTTIKLIADINLSGMYMQSYLVFKDKQCGVALNGFTNINGLSQVIWDLAPVGLDFTFIAIGTRDGKVYLIHSDHKITSGAVFNVKVKEISPEELKVALDLLDQ